MTKQEMQIAVAESVGWRFVHHPTTPNLGGYWEIGQSGIESYQRGDWGSKELAVGLPNYPQDLNAMHEAERYQNKLYNPVLSSPQFKTSYPIFLEMVVFAEHNKVTFKVAAKSLWDNGTYLGDYRYTRKAHQATAPQRCEAYLRVKGLWRDTGHA